MLAFLLVAVATYWGILYTHYLRPPVPEITTQTSLNEDIGASIPNEPFVLSSPSDALPGTVDRLEGTVTIQNRNAISAQSMTKSDTIVDGETVTTDPSGTVLFNIADKGSFTILPESQVTVINALDTSYLLTLQGSIDMRLKIEEEVAIRTQGLLVLLNGATASIGSNVSAGVVEIEVLDGDATIAYLDSSYETDVYRLESGEQASIQGGVFERSSTRR